MELEFSVYSAPLFLSAGLLFGLLPITWQRRHNRGALGFFLICLGIIIYQIGYALELSSLTVEDVLFWLGIEYIGLAIGPCFLFIFIVEMAQQEQFLPKKSRWLLFIIPLITVVLAWTNPSHELIWRDMYLDRSNGFTATIFERGLWSWVQLGYYFTLVILSLLLLVRTWRSVTRFRRSQLVFLALGTIIPIVMAVLYILGVAPEGLDINPYGLFFTAIFLALALLYSDLLDVLPMARTMILSNIADAFIVLDDKTRVVDINPAAEKLLKVDYETSLGQPAAKFFGPWSGLMEQYANAEQAEFEANLHGQNYFLELRQNRIFDEQGLSHGRLIVLRDITASKQMQQALENANETLLMLRRVDAELNRKLSVQYVLQIGMDAVVRWTHAETVAIALRREDGKMLVSDALGGYADQVGRVLDGTTGIVGRVLKEMKPVLILDVTKDPDYMPLVPETKTQLTLPLISGNRMVGILNIEAEQADHFTDEIYEMVRLLAGRLAVAIDNARGYEERESLVGELEAFAHTAAHDLKNPLGVIVGFSELLVTGWDGLPTATVMRYLGSIKNSAELSVEIVNALLLLAKVRTQSDIPLETLDMFELTQEAIERLELMVSDKGGEVRVRNHWLAAKGYAPWVSEIWVNYMSNAIKYGGQPPLVELGCNPMPDGMIRFWVKDNGNGLTPEEQAKLFAPFSRVGHHKVEGHGLGLSIVRRIAEKLGGTVGVESTVGRGSLFYFTLPAAEPPLKNLAPIQPNQD